MTRAAQYLIDSIEHVSALTNAERAAVAALPVTARAFKRGDIIVEEGDHPTHCFAILEGVTSMAKFTSGGDRQIVIYHFTGHIPDLHSLHLDRLDVSIEALNDCRLGFISHEAVRALCHKFPRVADALWRATLLDAAILREAILNIAQRPARARVAHFLCELVVRMKLAGLGSEVYCRVPLTQPQIGDCLGISYVHVNRIIQALRKKGLIDLKRSRLVVSDWEALKEEGDFDVCYLNLTERQHKLLGVSDTCED